MGLKMGGMKSELAGLEGLPRNTQLSVYLANTHILDQVLHNKNLYEFRRLG